MEELQMDLDELSAGVVELSTLEDQSLQETVSTLLQTRIPEDMAFIQASTTKMDGLINAILKLSRLGYGAMQFESVNLQAIISANINALAHMIKVAGVTITVGALPKLVSDQAAIEQIIGNLLSNAIKYLEPKRPGIVQIFGEVNQATDTVEIHFQDNGRGIAQEDMSKVFEIFQRVGKQDQPGEGMGLAYVWALIKRLGGKISCESTAGQGTTFHVILPNKR